VLRGNPDRFALRTGADAQALGRSERAELWQLADHTPDQTELEFAEQEYGEDR